MTWDEQVAEICRWCTKHGAQMHVPKVGSPYFTRKRDRIVKTEGPVYGRGPAADVLEDIRALRLATEGRIE